MQDWQSIIGQHGVTVCYIRSRCRLHLSSLPDVFHNAIMHPKCHVSLLPLRARPDVIEQEPQGTPLR